MTSADRLYKWIEQVLLAGLLGAITWGCSYLGSISHDINDIKTNVAVAIEKIRDHDKRLENLENLIRRNTRP